MKPVNLENEENNSITPSGFFGNSKNNIVVAPTPLKYVTNKYN